MRVALVLFVAAINSGCVADVGSLEGIGPVLDAGIVENNLDAGTETSVFDPSAELAFDAPRIIVEPGEEARGILQGDAFELVWTGSHYVFAWIENIRGHLFIVSAALDPSTSRLSDSVILSDDYDDLDNAAETLAMGFQGGRVNVVWSTNDALFVQQLDAFGRELPQRDAPSLLWQHDERSPLTLAMLPQGDGLLLLGSRRLLDLSVRSFALAIDREAMMIDEPKRFDVAGIPALDWRGELSVVWGERDLTGAGKIYLSRLDRDFVEQNPPEELYRATNVAPIFFGPNGDPRRLGIWSFAEGSKLLDLDGNHAPILLDEPGYNKPTLTQDPSGPRVALVYEAGEYRDTNPLPNRVEARALDYNADERNERRLVYDGEPDDECVERIRTTISGARLGVGFVTGCSTRRLRFVELRGEQR